MAKRTKATLKSRDTTRGASIFSVYGLHGGVEVHLPLDDDAAVFVGPNGLGKSTIISCLYLFLTSQWSRLSTYQFERIEYVGKTGNRIEITHLQCEQLARSPTRSGSILERAERRLLGTPEWDVFLSTSTLPPAEVRRLSAALGIPSHDLERIRYVARQQYGETGQLRFAETEAAIREEIGGQLLFLPTYRRIEQDFRALFPRLLEQIKRYGDEELAFDRKTDRYHEIIQFGMEDIQSLWLSTSESIRGYSRAQLNSLMSNYLRDVIRGASSHVDVSFFQDIQDTDIQKVLSRVEENALSLQDQDILRTTVQSLRDDYSPSTDALYLGYFFQRLSLVVTAIEQREDKVRNLVETLNGYFFPSKRVNYDPVAYTLTIENDAGQSIDLGSLSSGEKQIVSLFSILFLGDSSEHWIIIDEPELSLSVPWQEKFLDDIYKNSKCSKLIAVTHSPFVYANSLKPFAKDISLYIGRGDA
mgnify:CR=1 FL=1